MRNNSNISILISVLALSMVGSFANATEGTAKMSMNSSERCELKCYPYRANSCLQIATVEAVKECKALGLNNCKVISFREAVKTTTRKCKWGGLPGPGFYTVVEFEGTQN